MTVGQVIGQFRRYLQDTQKTRYAEDGGEPWDYFRLAFSALWNAHRHLFYVARIVNRIPALPSRFDANAELELLDPALDKLAHYMAHVALQEDAEDSHNLALSREHFALFSSP
jgi:hypothetical protein